MGRRSCALLAGALLAAAAGVRVPEKAHSHVLALANTSRASTGAEEAAGPLTCLAGLALSGFKIFEFDRYGEWFDDESVMTLAETGSYKGPDAIKEYVQYISEVSPWRRRTARLDQTPKFKSANAETGECVVNVFITSASEYEFSTLPTTKTLVAASLIQITYKLTGASGITISTANAYFPYGTTEAVQMLPSKDPGMKEGTIDYMCSRLKEKCPDTWEHNSYASEAECRADYSALPLLTYAKDKPRVDGNALGCKMLHASFAFTNPHHCAHMSIKPMADPDGKIKCQKENDLEPSDLFDSEDFAAFDSYLAQKGLPEEGFYLCDCTKDSRFNLWPFSVNRCGLC